MPSRLLAICFFAAGLLASALHAETSGILATTPKGVRSVAVEGGFMVPYTTKIPGTDVEFEMVPVPGRVIRVGLPEGETFEPSDDGFDMSKPILVRVEPFWIGKHEVTWAEYRNFMQLNDVFARIKQLRSMVQTASDESGDGAEVLPVLKQHAELWATLNKEPTFVDGVTSPTPLYYPEVTYESGEDPELPAVSMTQYAARQYTKWLSRSSGVEYRLPSEAEWEHAALAGGERVVGDVAAVAWNEDNSDYTAHHVGQLAPNAWGLHDMLGNAAEWVLDAPATDEVESSGKPISVAEAIHWPTDSYPHIAKGGYWDGPADYCRVASRLLSESWWKDTDPNLPKSPWWFSDAPAFGVGFRLVRPFKPMDGETKKLAWEIDNADLLDDVNDRLTERRGKMGFVDTTTPQAIEQLDSDEVSGLIE